MDYIKEIKEVKISLLKQDDKNPNVMTEKQLNALAKNISKYGFLVPVITNKEYLIADGHQRVKAAQKLGMTEVPVISLDVSEVDRLMIQQVMNKLRGEHEVVRDAEIFNYLLTQGADKEFLELMDLEKKKYEDYLKITESEEELYKKIIERQNANEKEIKKYVFTVIKENEEKVVKAIEKTGYKDQNRAFMEIIEKYVSS